MKKNLINFFKEEEGATLAEYGLLLALIAVVALTTLTNLGTTINTKLGQIRTALGG